MLTHHRRPVCLSLVSTDLPLGFTIETAATLYQKDKNRFHLLLAQPPFPNPDSPEDPPLQIPYPREKKGLLWLELSPFRAIATMQGNGKLGYRHFWERGVYGITRYWLHDNTVDEHGSFRLRNFTRRFELEGDPLPERCRIEYELWAEQVRLGSYILNLEIHH